ncbi:MlaD family protein [Saccharopolyspora sp. NPDC049426]|uniref:MlaD family protein n=1 Tax=Saccharopolyspora sp. NPDC049426 TaxID=3155652 RepID=UPI00343C51D3
MIKSSMRWLGQVSPLKLGVGFLVLALVSGVGLFQKNRIITTLSPGESVEVKFARDYRLKPFETKVKVAGVPVGTVTAVDQDDEGNADVSLKLDRGIRERLGEEPSAVIRPTTLLGGNYYVELLAGGAPGQIRGPIPVERAKTPVEVDRIAAALQPAALDGLRSSVHRLDATLSQGGQEALENLVRNAPDTLGPAGNVLDAAQGTRPDRDLTQLVGGLQSTASVLSEKQGQLNGIVSNLRTTTGTLSRQSGALSDTLHDLPETLTTARAGFQRMDGSVRELRATAGPARSAVRELDELLARTDPVLVKTRPVVSDLRGLLVDARPAVQELVPTSERATAVLNDVRGPVLDRVNGPIMQTVLSPYRGNGPYQGSGSDRPFYQELAHMIANLDSTSKLTDRNGAAIAFEPGIAPGSVGGLPISFDQLVTQLLRLQEVQR